MDEEVGMLYALWQKIETGKAAWVEEISRRHGVPTPSDLSSVYSLRIHADGPTADEAMADCTEVLTAVDLVHRNICVTLGIPFKNRLSYRNSADLWDREPLKAIAESALHFIDVALIGPENQAAALLAEDERLHVSARTRLLYMPHGDEWSSKVSRIIAKADTIIARTAIDAISNA